MHPHPLRPDSASWLLNYPYQVETVGVACSTPASLPHDLLSDVRTYYDNAAIGTAPVRGNVTRTEQAAEWTTEARYLAVSRANHDSYGRLS